MSSYRAYGLTIDSQPVLDCLRAGGGPADVRIRFVDHGDYVPSGRSEEFIFNGGSMDARLTWPGIVSIRVTSGTDVLVESLGPSGKIGAKQLECLLLGPALAVLLWQRGHLVLHASVVSTGEEAIAFLGRSGAGKSTVAAALHARGLEVIADDLAPIDCESVKPAVTPGFPRLKLDPQTALNLGFDESDFTASGAQGKIACRTSPVAGSISQKNCQDSFRSTHPLPLRKLYVLDRDAATGVRDVTGAGALMGLIQNSYCIRVIKPGSAEFSKVHGQCSHVARRIPLSRLGTKGLPDAAEELTQLVLEDYVNV